MLEARRIIALDPGITTGVAAITRGGVIEVHEDKYEVDSMWKAIEDFGPEVIVYEMFTPPSANRYRVELFPVQIIGVARLYALQHVIPEFSHTASAAKGLWKDDKIKRAGLWRAGQGHAMDALRHLLYHLTVTRKDESWVTKAR